MSADLHINNRQRQRYTQLALEHIVEKAVARIVIIIAVSAKTQLIKQITVEHDDFIGGTDVRTQTQ